MSGYSWTPLDFVNNNAGATAQLQSRVFDAYNFLEVNCFIPGYSTSGAIFRLQFNGDTGTTAYSIAVGEGATAPTTQVSATAAGWQCATTGQVARGLITYRIQNFNGQAKAGWWVGSTNSITAGSAPQIVQGAGVWANNAQIIRITMDVGSAGGTMNAGTQMWIMGMNGQ